MRAAPFASHPFTQCLPSPSSPPWALGALQAEKAGLLVNGAAAIPRINWPQYNWWSEVGVCQTGQHTSSTPRHPAPRALHLSRRSAAARFGCREYIAVSESQARPSGPDTFELLAQPPCRRRLPARPALTTFLRTTCLHQLILHVYVHVHLLQALHGVARNGVATSFPQICGVAASLNRTLWHGVGDVTSTEGRGKNNDVQSNGGGILDLA